MLIGMPTSRPTALLDFASGSIDPRLTFSRASTATRTNRAGVIETVASGVPRIDHDPLTGAIRGVLIEPQATNLLLQSDSFSSPWGFVASSIETSSVTAPDGVSAAKKLKDSSASGNHFMYQSAPVTAGTTYTFSIYAKPAELRKIVMVGQSPSFSANQAVFDLLTGATSSVVGCVVTMEQCLDGFFRCTWTATAATTGTANFYVYLTNDAGSASFTGTGSSGVYVWRAQLEVGSRATSGIQTTTAQVTRAADSLSLQSTAFSRAVSATQGSIYAEVMHSRAAWPASTPAILCLSDGSGTGETSGTIATMSASGTALDVTSSSTPQASLSVSAGGVAGIHRVALAYKADRFALTANGLTPVSDASGTPPAITRLDIGSTIGARHFNGWIRRVAVFPRAFDDVTLQNMSI